MLKQKPSFILLFLLISFGSVAAVLFTPAMPQIGQYFHISESLTQFTVTIYLVGYAVGQLIYGPLANGYGRKIALIIGISLEILASILCLIAGEIQAFWLLLLARLLMALGASVGLKMTFTLVADSYDAQMSTKIISYLMVAFAITPGLGVALGGFLTEHFDWQSCFVALGFYGLFLLMLAIKMPETAKITDKNALRLKYILEKYYKAAINLPLICGAAIMGAGTAFVYIFASLAPFVASNYIHLSPAQYGNWNLLPPIGMILGSQCAARLVKKLSPLSAIYMGLAITIPGILLMLVAFIMHKMFAIYLFLPLVIIYAGMSFIFGNASSLAMQASEDKSTASAMMNFINMGVATICVLLLGAFAAHRILLPIAFLGLVIVAFLLTSIMSILLKIKI